MIKADTKATSQHQVTIPKPIWAAARFKEGMRFRIELRDDRTILLHPQHEDLDLTDAEWEGLVRLAKDRRNVSRSFSGVDAARKYLHKL